MILLSPDPEPFQLCFIVILGICHLFLWISQQHGGKLANILIKNWNVWVTDKEPTFSRKGRSRLFSLPTSNFHLQPVTSSTFGLLSIRSNNQTSQHFLPLPLVKRHFNRVWEEDGNGIW